MRRIRYEDVAREELFKASDFYDRASPGTGARFLDEVDRALALLAENAYLGARSRHGGRHFVLRHFSYSIIYRIRPDEVVVICIHNQRERPGYWRYR